MRPIGLAAIAITLIIAVPIILGYGLASEETEYTKTTESGTASLTDTLFNAESDYYIDYTKTSNNSQMLQRVTAQGDNYYVYASPDYVSTGSTYTSVPAYETTTHTTTDSSSDVLHTYSATINSGDPNRTVGSVIGDYHEFTSDWGSNFGGLVSYTHSSSHCTEYIAIDNATTYVFIEGLTDTSLNSMYGTTAGGLSASSVSWVWNEDDDNWIFTVGTTQYTANWAVICCVYHGDYTWNQYDFDTISPVYDGESVDNWTFAVENPAMVKLTYADGTVTYKAAYNSVYNTAAFTIVDDEDMGKTSSVGISFVGSGVLTYYTQDYTEYADIAYGWYNADSDYSVYYNAWYNQYENATVTFYLHFEGNGQSEFYESFTETSPLITFKRIDGIVYTVDSDLTVQTLGSYEYIRVVFDALEDLVTVSGVSSFPPMGGTADLLNTVEVNYDFDGYVEFLKIVDQFDTVSEQTAEYYAENGESTTVTLDRAIGVYNYYYLKNEATSKYVTDGWSATWVEEGSTDVVFTPTSLADGYYILGHYSPPPSSGSVRIYVGDVNSVSTSPIAYRVDRATVVAGQYPSTTDYTLDLWGLFPSDTVQKLYINSIGVYGDSIRLATRTYDVNNGSIDVTDIETGNTYTVKLLKSTITIELDDDGYYNMSINNIPISHGAVAQSSTIYFGGEWSLTATRSTVVEETAVKTSWVPGEFALDKDGFVLAMVLTAAAAFVVLGMTGARSGAKVGLLALICGGACAVGLIIL